MSDFAGAWDSAYHAPALVSEVVDALGGPSPVLDGTLGGGGHAAALSRQAHGSMPWTAILTPLQPHLRVSRTRRTLGRFRAFVANFAALDQVPALEGLRYDGVLLDLGVSSHQLDDPARGFSFRRGEPLDMRTSGSRTLKRPAEARGPVTMAAELLNTAGEGELAAMFRDFADEPRAGRLARAIVHASRDRQPFATSDDLVDAIRAALGARIRSLRFRPLVSRRSASP